MGEILALQNAKKVLYRVDLYILQWQKCKEVFSKMKLAYQIFEYVI